MPGQLHHIRSVSWGRPSRLSWGGDGWPSLDTVVCLRTLVPFLACGAMHPCKLFLPDQEAVLGMVSAAWQPLQTFCHHFLRCRCACRSTGRLGLHQNLCVLASSGVREPVWHTCSGGLDSELRHTLGVFVSWPPAALGPQQPAGMGRGCEAAGLSAGAEAPSGAPRRALRLRPARALPGAAPACCVCCAWAVSWARRVAAWLPALAILAEPS